ncbi:MAG: four helix bundle protein [Bacteroidetes bacterium]|nr:MAG: four helix bundle protein [Bacteroidota bacterium]
MKKTTILDRSFLFSLKIIDLYKQLIDDNEYIISKQLLKSATSIGANVHEASAAFSKRDFAYKMSIASKEARETQYWLKLLDQSKLVHYDLTYFREEIINIINITTAIVKTAQKSLS